MNLFINYPLLSTLCIILLYLIFFIIIFLIIKLPEPFSNIIAAFAAIISLVFSYVLILIF